MNQHESRLQKSLILWANYSTNIYPELIWLYHIPNGKKRNVIDAVNLKKEGVKSGVADLCLPVPAHSYHGLYMETKYGKNDLTKEQNDFKAFVTVNGYLFREWRSLEEGIAILKWYLQGKIKKEAIN